MLIRFRGPGKSTGRGFLRGFRFRLGYKDIFAALAQRKRKRGMKIWIKKLIGNRSPLMGIVLSVILSLSWGLVITLFWGK